MYDIDRYYREKIFVEFDTEEEFERFHDEAKAYAEANALSFSEGDYGSRYYTASWYREQKVPGRLGFMVCNSTSFLNDLEDWHIVNAKVLEVFNFDPGEVLEFIGV